MLIKESIIAENHLCYFSSWFHQNQEKIHQDQDRPALDVDIANMQVF